MLKSFVYFNAIILSLLHLFSCASELPNKLVDNKPRGSSGKDIDMSQIEFIDYASGNSIDLREYMIDNNKDFLLITFGSKGCGSCNAKAKKLTDSVIGKHPLFLTEEGKKFGIVGVATDQEDFSVMARYLSLYPYIQWNDPRGLQMIENFMPENTAFSVPLTAMVSRVYGEKVNWIVPPSSKTTVEEIMSKVVVTLGIGDATPHPKDPPPTDGGGDDGDTDVETPASPIDMPLPGRFKGVEVAGCGATGKSLDELFGDSDLKILQVVETCGADCKANIAQLNSFQKGCENEGAAKTCKIVTLSSENFDNSLCDATSYYEGGKEFQNNKWKSLLNWDYEIAVDAATYEVSIAEVTGPMIFAFAKEGQLLFTHEGAIDSSILNQWHSSNDTINQGPNFAFYKKEDGVPLNFQFSEMRKQSKYTIVNVWTGGPPPCSNCIDELSHWSEPGGLFEFCEQNSHECSVVALETGVPDPVTDQAMSDYFDGWINGIPGDFDGFKAMGIHADVMLDPHPNWGDNGDEFKDRFFDGYLQASRPDLYTNPRSIIYDREGKLLATFETPLEPKNEPDHVFLKIKELLQIEAEVGETR